MHDKCLLSDSAFIIVSRWRCCGSASSPPFASFIRSESVRFGKVIREAGIKTE